jgi:hypothetical protein
MGQQGEGQRKTVLRTALIHTHPCLVLALDDALEGESGGGLRRLRKSEWELHLVVPSELPWLPRPAARVA